MRPLILLAVCVGALYTSAGAQQPAPPAFPATDIYLVPLSGGLASMKTAKPSPMSIAAGYDNQPMFSADGARVLFAANRDGKQIDIFVYDRAANRVHQLTETAENENSPTFLPVGVGAPGGFSVVRTEPDKSQRLWRFDAQGRNPAVVLAKVKPVGYHAWVDADTVVLYVLGSPSTLQIAHVKNGTAEIVADNIGRSLHRVPGTDSASFVQREPSGEFWVKQIDVASKKIDPLVKAVDGSNGSRHGVDA